MSTGSTFVATFADIVSALPELTRFEVQMIAEICDEFSPRSRRSKEKLKPPPSYDEIVLERRRLLLIAVQRLADDVKTKRGSKSKTES